jgi:hypothetical protein
VLETTRIEIKGFDGNEYVVIAIPWVAKNDLREDCTAGSLLTNDVKFDRKKFLLGMFKLTTTKNGKPLTDSDIASWDGKTGDAIDIAVFKLNELSKGEKANLLLPPDTRTSQCQSSASTT